MQFPPIQELITKIDILMKEIHSMRPLSAGELRELQKSLRVMEVYNSNAIEGNTLTLGETKLVIEDGITIWGKTIREMHEAENLAKAIDQMLAWTLEISEKSICEIHWLIMKNIDDENAGKYRNIQVYISGEEIKPPQSSGVPELMSELINWYRESSPLIKGAGGIFHPTLLASEFHYRFVKIHPFVDGNGRTARLLTNIILMSHGYPMIIVPIVRRMDYINSLNSLTGNQEVFQNYYADIIHENLRDYIRMISA